MLIIRSLLIVMLLVGATLGQTQFTESDRARGNVYTEVDLTEVMQYPDRFAGRRITLTAEVVSVSAKYQSLHLYDAQSRALIDVSLARLNKSIRHTLVRSPIHNISVRGRLNFSKGRIVVEAEKVEPVMIAEIVDLAGVEGH